MNKYERLKAELDEKGTGKMKCFGDSAKVILGDYRPFSFDEISRILSKREFKGVDHHEER